MSDGENPCSKCGTILARTSDHFPFKDKAKDTLKGHCHDCERARINAAKARARANASPEKRGAEKERSAARNAARGYGVDEAKRLWQEQKDQERADAVAASVITMPKRGEATVHEETQTDTAGLIAQIGATTTLPGLAALHQAHGPLFEQEDVRLAARAAQQRLTAPKEEKAATGTSFYRPALAQPTPDTPPRTLLGINHPEVLRARFAANAPAAVAWAWSDWETSEPTESDEAAWLAWSEAEPPEPKGQAAFAYVELSAERAGMTPQAWANAQGGTG